MNPAEHWPAYRQTLPTTARKVADHELAVLNDLARWEFRGGNAALADHPADDVVLSGPAGTGKSVAALHLVADLAARWPGMRALLVRKTAVSLAASGLVTWRERVIPGALAAKAVVYYGGSQQEPPQYRFWNGSRVMIGGLDNAGKVMSTEYDFIFCQEAIDLSEADWEALSTRLRNGVLPRQRMVGDTNPSTPQHWLMDRVKRGDTAMLESRHEDNPSLFSPTGEVTDVGAVYLNRLDKLTGVRKARLRYGQWVAAEGQVYEGWDQAVHVIPRFDIPKEWPRVWSVDFGFTNPFVCQWWAIDPDGRMVMYREHYRTQWLVEDHAKFMLAQVTDEAGEWTEPKPDVVVCDHDAEDRATLKRHLGLPTVAARKSVRTGIEAVATRLRLAGDGRPRLVMFADALIEPDPDLLDQKKPVSTVTEMAGYVWARSREGVAEKEEPVKVDDHGVDATRYAVMHLDRPKRNIYVF